jgi:hypothetical protein
MQVKESAFTPQRQGSFLNLLITIAICAGIAWLVLRACSAVTTSKVELPSIAKPEATAIATSVPAIQQYCFNGKCVSVKMCTAVNDECGSMEQGPPADYGTGFHVSADSRTRPNPPAGWKWAGQ